MKTIKSIITAIIIIVTMNFSTAQIKPTFELKVAPYTFVYSGVGLGAEIDAKVIGAEVDFTSFKFTSLGYKAQNTSLIFKYFPSKKANATGIYAIVNYKYNNVADTETKWNDTGDFGTTNYINKYTYSSVGFGGGYKLMTRHNIVFDLGASIGKIVSKSSDSAPRIDGKAYFKVGYRF